MLAATIALVLSVWCAIAILFFENMNVRERRAFFVVTMLMAFVGFNLDTWLGR